MEALLAKFCTLATEHFWLWLALYLLALKQYARPLLYVAIVLAVVFIASFFTHTDFYLQLVERPYSALQLYPSMEKFDIPPKYTSDIQRASVWGGFMALAILATFFSLWIPIRKLLDLPSADS